MKYFKLIKQIAAFVIAVFVFVACKKVATVEPLGDQGQQIIRIKDYGGIGKESFAKASLAFDLTMPIDSVEVHLEYSTPKVADQEITVTLVNDAAALNAYNAAQPSGGIIYSAFSNSQYQFRASTVKIKAGQMVSEAFYIIIYPDQLDPAVSYMLPLNVTNIAGAPANVTKASGTSIAYFHIIGNPLAGGYKWDFKRWNLAAQSTGLPGIPPNGGSWVAAPTTFSSVSPTSFTTPSGYYVQPNYLINFVNNNGTLSGFTVEISPPDLAFLISAGITFVEPPTLLIADPVTKRFKIQYQVFNGTAYRYIIDEYYK